MCIRIRDRKRREKSEKDKAGDWEMVGAGNLSRGGCMVCDGKLVGGKRFLELEMITLGSGVLRDLFCAYMYK